MSTLLKPLMNLMGAQGPTSSQRIAAALAAANADQTNVGIDFYAELGTPSGLIWNNGGVGFGASPPTTTGIIPVASISKSLYAIWFCQNFTPTNTDYFFLTMTSNYDLMNGRRCDQTNSNQTVDQCLLMGNTGTYKYGQYDTLNNNRFSYDSAHWEKHLSNLGAPYNGWTRANIRDAYRSTFGVSSLTLTSPMPAGGVQCTPLELRHIIQSIANGTLTIGTNMVDSRPPVPASYFYNQPGQFDIVANSPAPANEAWTYKWGLWIEPGGQYYWMCGSYGSCIWVKSDFSVYGMVIRNTSSKSVGGDIGITSIRTAQSIRNSYMSGRYVSPTTNLPPVANFTYSISGQSVVFTDTSSDSDGNVVAWDWDFGDGTETSLQNPTHTYGTTGTYAVVLTAIDNSGATNQKTQSITV